MRRGKASGKNNQLYHINQSSQPFQHNKQQQKDMSKFAPKQAVQLDPPRDDAFTKADLAQFDGNTRPERYIAIKGTVFDVTNNVAAYGPGTKYNALVGKDASRALGKSSLKEEDTDPSVSHDTTGFTERQHKVLDDWFSFFVQRYNVVGRVVDL